MIHTGDCVEVMAGMPADSVDAVVTDPPYGIGFMGKAWDAFDANPVEASWSGKGRNHTSERNPEAATPGGRSATRTGFRDTNPRCALCGRTINGRDTAKGFKVCHCEAPVLAPTRNRDAERFQKWCELWGAEAWRVTKPGGYLLAFGGTRTHHRLVCGLEDAGWIIRDELTWVYACLSDDTEILTLEHGWVPYNRASEGDHAAGFDTNTGRLRYEPIEVVHRYDHEGPMAAVGPCLVTLNHRVILDAETGDVPRLPGLWEVIYPPLGVGEADPLAELFPPVQREAPDSRSPVQAGAGVERGAEAAGVGSHEGSAQLGLEGRRYRVQEAWELFGGSVRSGAGVGEADGPQGRLHHGAPTTYGGLLRLLADSGGVRQPREPRPDRQQPRESDALAGQSVAQALRVEPVYARHSLPVDAPRLVDYAGVVWCITVPSGAFLARRNGVAFVTGNSGFPKGKANLKPAHEPIVLARKPGPLRALNIDASRIPGEPWVAHDATGLASVKFFTDGETPVIHKEPHNGGRWPSNLLLQDPELFDVANPGVVGSGAVVAGAVSNGSKTLEGHVGSKTFAIHPREQVPGYGDSGGYSRFFIVPKADRADREPVLRGQLEAKPIPFNGHSDHSAGMAPGSVEAKMTTSPRENAHPTVKPTDLMRHLVRLVTPSRNEDGEPGLVLDCFLGSGSTAIACELEGFRWIGIEQDESYVEIAKARLNGVQRGLGLAI